MMQVCVVWLIGGFVYYGITLSAGSISKEIHLNMFLMGLVEIPAYVLSRYLADTAGRKSSYISLTLLAAFFCLVSWSYPRKGGRLLFALVGKIFASGAFSLVWMWSPEIFPTGARSLTTAIGSQAARVGSILAPYVRHSGRHLNTLSNTKIQVVVLMSEMESTVDGSGCILDAIPCARRVKINAGVSHPPLPQPVSLNSFRTLIHLKQFADICCRWLHQCAGCMLPSRNSRGGNDINIQSPRIGQPYLESNSTAYSQREIT
mmetsp:Transcript_24347/g.79562  ORF Transcript_24347/g.79562 Transcript_24347/m.79562 type:complete len:261 (-) Transcript_24347:1553-2335(-)